LRRVPSAGSNNGSRSTSPDTRSASQQQSQQLQPLPQQQQQQQPLALVASAAWLIDLATDAKALGEILVHADVPRPSEGSLAREAVGEGLERFGAFREWVSAAAASAVATLSSANGAVACLNGINGPTTTTLEMLMDSAPEDVPLLILLPVLLSQAWLVRSSSTTLSSSTSGRGTPTGEKEKEMMVDSTLASASYPGVAKVIGYESEETYRRGVLCGFRRAEECEVAIAKCLLGRLGTGAGAGVGPWAEGVTGWLAQRAG